MSDSPIQIVGQLVERLRAGDPRALGRAISLVESDAPEADQLLQTSFPLTGQALRIGITGAPGAGKSTLVDALARLFREAGKTVGVVAVDPSSPYSGGAILGDRIRFQGFAADAGFYARSMASRGALGGLARTTSGVVSLIEASGKELILIETVGVGQAEVDIARLADITVVVLVPGMGDAVQTLKAGILEIADVFAINKSDRDGADALEGELAAAMALGHGREPGWAVPVVRTIALEGAGVSELAAAVTSFQQWLRIDGRLEQRRAMQWRERILERIQWELLRQIQTSMLPEAELAALATQVAAGAANPYDVIPHLLAGLKA